MDPGEYQVSAYWKENSNRSQQSPFTISGGDAGDVNVIVNQELASTGGPTESGYEFQNLGGTITVSGTTLTVTLSSIPAGSLDAGDSNGTKSRVFADAVRIEKVGEVGPALNSK